MKNKTSKKKFLLLVTVPFFIIISIAGYSPSSIYVDSIDAEKSLLKASLHCESLLYQKRCNSENIDFVSLKTFSPVVKQWMKERVYKDMKRMRSVSLSDMYSFLESEKNSEWHHYCLIAIRNGVVYFQDYSRGHDSLYYVIRALHLLSTKVMLPDCEFIVCLDDYYIADRKNFPVFTFCKKKSDFTSILIPDYEALQGYKRIDSQIEAAVKDSPWNSKKNIAFWRGTTRGGIYNSDAWKTYPRSMLVLSAQKISVVDACFAKLIKGSTCNKELMQSVPKMTSSYVSPVKSIEYKYLIDVDSIGCSFSRLHWALLSNSSVVKQESEYMQWYYNAMQPYTHYLPYNVTCSDLQTKVDWLINNDEEAEKIAMNGRDFAFTHLSAHETYTYLYYVIKEYAKKERNDRSFLEK